MAVAQEIQEQIERDITHLSETDYRRPSMKIDQFVMEFSGTILQLKLDREKLEQSGFNWERVALFEGLLDNLLDAIRDRTSAILCAPQARAAFNEQMQIAVDERKVLREVALAIIELTGDKDLKFLVRGWLKGNRKSSILMCNLHLVSLISEHPRIAACTRPGGIAVDAAYLEQAGARAVELLRMQGIVLREDKPEKVAVARQKRLITLCMAAQHEIKKAARVAFYDDLEYFRQHYCSKARRQYVRCATPSAPSEHPAIVSESV